MSVRCILPIFICPLYNNSQESAGQWESGVPPGQRVPPGFRVFPVPRANKDLRVTEVNLECREHQDYR